MKLGGWVCAAALAALLVGCTTKAAGPATLAPLTSSATSTTSTTPAVSSTPSPTMTTLSPVSPSVTPLTAGPSLSSNPSRSASPPTGDNSEAAAIAAAKNAVVAIFRVSQTLDLTEFSEISHEHCNYRNRMTSVVYNLRLNHARVVGKLPTRMITTIVSRSTGVLRVGVAVSVPASETVSLTGKVSNKLPSYNDGFIMQMNYIGGRWLLYYVEDVQ